MDAPRRGTLLLGAVGALLAVACAGSSPHSLRYFHTALSEPGQGLPQFVTVGYVDDQPIDRYDSRTRKMRPEVPWMEKVVEYDPHYWEGQSRIVQDNELVFRADLATMRERYKQPNSTGLHTWQLMYGCEVGPDGRLRGGHLHYGYNGEDFLAFDRQTTCWTASVPQALISKQKLDMRQDICQHFKDYLESTCVGWLRRYLDYGKEALQRTEAPMVRVTRKKGFDGRETLFCHLYGFYPKDIEVTWMKDKEDQKPETYTGGVVPNSDGTYNTWLSIEVDPKERDRYRCRVGHDSLLEPLDLAWEEPAPNLGLILGITGGVLAVAILLGAGVAHYMKKQRQEKGYGAPPVKCPLEGGIEASKMKYLLEEGYKPMLNGCQRHDSDSSGSSSKSTGSSDGSSSQSTGSSDCCSDPGSESTKALV